MAIKTVIIATAGRSNEPLRLLRALSAQTMLPDEVVIVPGDDIASQLDISVIHNLDIVILPLGESGLPKQRNRGCEFAPQTDIFFFFDDDFIPEPEYISQMMQEFDEHPEVVAAGGQTTGITPPRLWARVIQRFFGLTRLAKRSYLQRTGFPALAYGRNGRQKATVFSGSNFAVRYSVWSELRFDERLAGYAWMEDDDFSFRASLRGTVMEVPTAKGQHLLAPGNRGNSNPTVESFRRMRNHAYLHRKLLGGNCWNYLCRLWGQVGMLIHETLVRHSFRRAWGTLKGIFSFAPPDKF
jgi:GT2 family glycosyltransferase